MPSRIKDILLFVSAVLICQLLFLLLHHPFSLPPPLPPPPPPPTTAVSLSHSDLAFSIASSSSSLANRIPYIQLWFSPNSTPNAYLFLDQNPTRFKSSLPIPRIFLSSDTSRFPFTFPRGNRAAVRIAYTVKDVFALANPPPNIKWFVFCDDDTVLFTRNLVRVLSKYDHNKWYYIGSNSESYEQNQKFSFDMAFGGGGFALSAPLAKVLAGKLDSCLFRYPHLYGSDQRIFACLTELGVQMTREPGFHQIDVRGDVFGMLVAHPLSPLLSLHHMDAVEPIFPGMRRIQALGHLFKAANADPTRMLQQTVCYDLFNSLTVSISWGYAIQLFEGNRNIPDLLALERTFKPWGRGQSVYSSRFMFNTRDLPRNRCSRPVIFFFDSISSYSNLYLTNYIKKDSGNCFRKTAVEKVASIRVFSKKFDFEIEQIETPRRQCCDIRSPISTNMTIDIRQCKSDIHVTFHEDGGIEKSHESEYSVCCTRILGLSLKVTFFPIASSQRRMMLK
ncbi:OLC1v1025068C1 [Oldenlandia corymbosa var. corymbosa]|uniref:OLC1v1025068C1 n=1 Tax=Oldenlandia corymbosa var. corymbosa TaxID=529605 RepID=A0AAV1C591_OLDCO|nr:OLC1v1025068C1 [Oldenlandia corymbosa var. corymbosa]